MPILSYICITFVHSALFVFFVMFSSKNILTFVMAATAAFATISCNNERQEVVEQAVRIISEATMEMQDVDNLELRHLKSLPASLQTSLYVLQNRHPDVRLTEDDTKTIEKEMAKFTKAQENAILIFQRRINELEESIIKLTNNDESEDGNEA